MASALIMAGGRSSRMRATRGPQHKALVEVLGIPMIERNLNRLLDLGVRELSIAISAGEHALEAWFEERGEARGRSAGATIRLIVEDRPLGTIGAAALVTSPETDLIVINVDNLSAIDLRALLLTHVASHADMTVAVHEEDFDVQFGVVRVEGDRVVEYLEKPHRRMLISSGTYILGPAARAAIRNGEPASVPALVAALNAAGKRVTAYQHDAPWIDVNDAESLKRAEAMIDENEELFAPERWPR